MTVLMIIGVGCLIFLAEIALGAIIGVARVEVYMKDLIEHGGNSHETDDRPSNEES